NEDPGQRREWSEVEQEKCDTLLNGKVWSGERILADNDENRSQHGSNPQSDDAQHRSPCTKLCNRVFREDKLAFPRRRQPKQIPRTTIDLTADDVQGCGDTCVIEQYGSKKTQSGKNDEKISGNSKEKRTR